MTLKFTSPEFGQAAIDEARALHERGEIDQRTFLYASEAIKRIWYHTSALPSRYEAYRDKITGYKLGARIFLNFVIKQLRDT